MKKDESKEDIKKWLNFCILVCDTMLKRFDGKYERMESFERLDIIGIQSGVDDFFQELGDDHSVYWDALCSKLDEAKQRHSLIENEYVKKIAKELAREINREQVRKRSAEGCTQANCAEILFMCGYFRKTDVELYERVTFNRSITECEDERKKKERQREYDKRYHSILRTVKRWCSGLHTPTWFTRDVTLTVFKKIARDATTTKWTKSRKKDQ